MPEPVHIDLRNLTPAHLAAALHHLGACAYRAPCIIGTLMPKEFREQIPPQGARVGTLVDRGLVVLPRDQRKAAEDLQKAFDNSDSELVAELAQPWLDDSPPPEEN